MPNVLTTLRIVMALVAAVCFARQFAEILAVVLCVIAALLDQAPELEPDPDPDGRYERQWLPWRTGTDGFYAARLRRRRSVADGVE